MAQTKRLAVTRDVLQRTAERTGIPAILIEGLCARYGIAVLNDDLSIDLANATIACVTKEAYHTAESQLRLCVGCGCEIWVDAIFLQQRANLMCLECALKEDV